MGIAVVLFAIVFSFFAGYAISKNQYTKATNALLARGVMMCIPR